MKKLEKSLNKRPFTWWFTGLPGAGKTTLANALCVDLRLRGEFVCLLDGDELRQGVNSDLDFSATAREENMRRVAEIARLLNAAGVNAVVALVSPTRQGRGLARRIVGAERFFEVYVATPLAVCMSRDPKGLYARAKTDASLGLTGVQASYEAPSAPELSIDTSQINLPDALKLLLAMVR